MDGKGDLLKHIRERLASYDDDALASLANIGLVRRARKDLESLPPVVKDEQDGKLLVEVGDCVVRLSENLQQSACSCPSGTTCRHILAALISIKESVDVSAPSEENPEPLKSCAEEILAVDDETLKKWAGTPLIRKAAQKLAFEIPVEFEDSIPFVFRIPAWNITCRWMPGGGLDGMVCSCHKPGACEHKVEAILAYQAEKGTRVIEEEAAVIRQSSGSPRTRDEVLESVGIVLREMLSHGLSRVSKTTGQRFQTLAVSAHGVDLPRLEKTLNALADEVSLLLSRNAQADTRAIVTAAARTQALCHALSKNLTPALVGEHRSTYERVGDIELVGMGARRWRTRSGYAGLTVYFWDRPASNWATWTDARPLNVEEFDGMKRYRLGGPWPGCPCPADASRNVLRLSPTWKNRSGRISGREGASAVILGLSDPMQVVQGITSWVEILDKASGLFGEGFRDRSEQDEVVVIQPSKWGTPVFDKIRQELVMPVYDQQGLELKLVLPHTPETADAIASMEKRKSSDFIGLLGLLKISSGRIVIEPVTLYEKKGIFNLTLDVSVEVKRNWKPEFLQRIVDSGEDEEVKEDQEQLDGSGTSIGMMLTNIQSELEAIAEGGVSSRYDTTKLRSLAAKSGAIGLGACERTITTFLEKLDNRNEAGILDNSSSAESLLKAYYVTRTAAVQEIIMSMFNN